MRRAKKRRRSSGRHREKFGRYCDPTICPDCTYIGEGDFICQKDAAVAAIVVADWEPTEDFRQCARERSYCR